MFRENGMVLFLVLPLLLLLLLLSLLVNFFGITYTAV